MSTLNKIRRWVLRPLSVVAILIGIGGYLFSALSANQMKIDETTGFDAFTPSEVSADLGELVRGLERYIEYRETGQVVVGIINRKAYSSVRLVTYVPSYPRYPGFGYQSDELEIFVSAKYHNQPPALLRDVLRNLNVRYSVASIQRNAAEVYLNLLIAGGSIAILVLLLPKIIVVGQMIPFLRIWSVALREWRKLMILASVVWAVLATWEMNPNRSSDYAIIIGPFVIAITIYFLFLRQSEKNNQNQDNVNSSDNQSL